MKRSKVHMPKELEKKCHIAIHAATAAAAAAGAIPIPMSDAIPITGAQISMIIALGQAFGLTISESTAKAIMGVTLTQQLGRALTSNILKMVPGVRLIVGSVIGATTAAALTEALGWLVADDFYRMSQGQNPENIVENAGSIKSTFEGLRYSQKG